MVTSVVSASTGSWGTPKERNAAQLADPDVYVEVLTLCSMDGVVSKNTLMSESEGLAPRLRRLWLVKGPSGRGVSGVLSTLRGFGWLTENPRGSGQFRLTPQGQDATALATDDRRPFLRLVARRTQERYLVPGWLIATLFDLNPLGQGEVVVPAPRKEWLPEQRRKDDKGWTDELAQEAMDSAARVRHVFAGSFPVEDATWCAGVRDEWQRLGSLRGRKRRRDGGRPKASDATTRDTFSPRERLTQAMQTAAVRQLFRAQRFWRGPMPLRTFKAWCARLDELELLCYTDSHPLIAGRLLFPCAAFREDTPGTPFERLEGVTDHTKRRGMYLHQPSWSGIAEVFLATLEQVHRRISWKVGSLYVSLLDVRDEMCRQIRVSTALFDVLLQAAYRETIRQGLEGKHTLSISLESDIRPEQRSGFGLLRRPVYIDGVPHSLVAIARAPVPTHTEGRQA